MVYVDEEKAFWNSQLLNFRSANGCNGAYISAYPDFIVESNQGALAHQNGYPYTATRGSCKGVPNYNTGAKASQALFTGNTTL